MSEEGWGAARGGHKIHPRRRGREGGAGVLEAPRSPQQGDDLRIWLDPKCSLDWVCEKKFIMSHALYTHLVLG